MTTLVALLRGINVGKAKRVRMADLRALTEDLGYTDVRTLLNSGNLVFTAPARSAGDAGERIAEALEERFGVASRIIVLTAAELHRAVEGNPLLDLAADPARLLVAVLAAPAARAELEPLTARDWRPEALALGERVAYLWCAEGILKSPLSTAVSRAAHDALTSRNWTTLCKLDALASGPP